MIYKKELHSYFNNMTGYIFMAFIFLIIGLYTSSYNLMAGSGNFEYVLGAVGFVYIVIVPILTMRVLAEEKRQKTDQLLFTAPISIAKIIIGKYLAMVTVLLFPILVICIYPLILSMYGSVPMLVAYSSILGFFFMGATLISVGMFISSLTESQLIAAVLSFGFFMLTYMMDGITDIISSSAFGSLIAFMVVVIILALFLYNMTYSINLALIFGIIGNVVLILLYRIDIASFEGGLSAVLGSLAFYNYLSNFVYNGIFDLTAIVYYLSIICLFVFLSTQSIQKRRWS